jgi:hypothetical protein
LLFIAGISSGMMGVHAGSGIFAGAGAGVFVRDPYRSFFGSVFCFDTGGTNGFSEWICFFCRTDSVMELVWISKWIRTA